MIIGPELKNREPECEAVLRTLPDWFGIEDSLLMYARNTGKYPTLAIEKQSKVIAFITLLEHFPESWEVHCIAVSADERNKGLGTKLLKQAEQWLVKKGAKYLQVKTLAATAESEEYAQTRQFYLRRGFTPVEVFTTLWSPENPALQLIKNLPSG